MRETQVRFLGREDPLEKEMAANSITASELVRGVVPKLLGNIFSYGASLIAQLVKNLPAMQQTWVRFLGREDPLEKEMVTHSSIVAWRIPWMEKPSRL